MYKRQYLNDFENLIETNKIYVGFEIESKLLKEIKGVTELDIMKLKECLTFLIKTIEKVKERSPFKCKTVRGLASFDPIIIINRSSIGKNRINVLLEVLYEKNRITEVTAEKVKQQYSVLCNDCLLYTSRCV